MNTEKQRENVVRGLECIRDWAQFTVNHGWIVGGASEKMVKYAEDALALLQQPVTISRWVKVTGDFMTPGGTPYFVCGQCGGSGHLYGVEYSKRKVLCDRCGCVNIYPWEQAHEVGSSLWEEPKEVRP